MKWIGLTGGIATGKSTAAKLLRDLGLPVIDADQLARDVVSPGSDGLKAVIESFGEELLNQDGGLDRKALGRIVFTSDEQLEKLESLLHPLIESKRAEEKRRLESENVEMAFYDVPLLFETDMQDEFDKIILIYADQDTQVQRMKERDQLSEAEILQRIKSQIPIEEKKKKSDFVVINSGSIADLKNQLVQVVSEIKG